MASAQVFELPDVEFGTVLIRCNPRARRVILRVKHDASVHITVPHKRHLPAAQKLLNDARGRIRVQREELTQSAPNYAPGAMVGRSHQLVFRAQPEGPITTRVSENQIIVKYPFALSPEDEQVQQKVRVAVKKALRRQAGDFLPQRLAHLAHQWGLTYKEVHITSGSTRWGSCSSDNTINLNLSLMTLPDYLVDYVICHELCHTIQHNHSDRFWELVANLMPEWKAIRKELKDQYTF
ncbi:MAG TPA: SprT family zinc-dependent metalloprotease [Candidatus Saccharimonadales bacterium]|nr:SprT family zinc-dependent metalloprotease [Candidatus Saccharimonadales bacterium]